MTHSGQPTVVATPVMLLSS